jgi:HEPN domain-containing protein
MRPDAHEEGLRWLEQAEEDLASAEVLLREGRFYLVCFLAQQAAENAFKAYLYAAGEDPVLGHSVEELGRRAAAIEPGLDEVREPAAELDAYYLPTRYPNSLPASIPVRVFGRIAAGRALDTARDVVAAVRLRWPAAEAGN